LNTNFKDYYIVTIIGFLVGWLALLPAVNIGVKITPFFVIGSVVGFSLFAPFALAVLNFLSRFWKFLAQFSKFAAVGTLNTFIDLSVLNFLIYLTGVAAGFYFSVFKSFSFLIATTNSYFWNKFWTFNSQKPVTSKEYSRFLFFTLIGTLINVSVASFIVNFIGPLFGVSLKLWANIGAIIAVFAAMMWNFLSYRNVVFKKSYKYN